MSAKQQDSLQQVFSTYSAYMDSPIGKLVILADDLGVTEIRFPNKAAPTSTKKYVSNHLTSEAINQLQAYFGGKLKDFDLPLRPAGSKFQKAVWRQLKEVSFGTTASYQEVAIAIGNPKAARAVGMANRKNPIPIVVPCHRIIGSDGSLTGFAGGLETKHWLLAHEKETF